MVTKVPSSGSLRRTLSGFGCGARQLSCSQQMRPNHKLKRRQQAADAVGDVAAGEGGAADVVNVVIDLKAGSRGLAFELVAPLRVVNLAAVILAVFEQFNLKHFAFG